MPRVLGLLAFAALAVLYYYAFGPVPTPTQLANLPWWQPRGWALRWDAFAALKQFRDAQGAARLIPVAVFALPVAALALPLLRTSRSAALRVAVATLSLTCCAFVYYGYLAPSIWRFFEWRAPAATASFFGLLMALAFSPSLLREVARQDLAARTLCLLLAVGAIYALSTEITGTNPHLSLNLSPWPVLTLFGLLLFGCALGVWHVAAGAGLLVASRVPRLRAAVAGLVAAAVGGVGSALALHSPPAPVIVVCTLISASYGVIAAARAGQSAVVSGIWRASAGGLMLASILLSNQAAISAQERARDVTAASVVSALHRYHEQHGSYPDSLENLVPEYLSEVPRPRMGLYPHDDETFTYSNFGDSFALEFASVQWVQCAYSPAYVEAFGAEDWNDEGAGEGADEVAAGESLPDVAAGPEADLGESWTCESRPPDLW